MQPNGSRTFAHHRAPAPKASRVRSRLLTRILLFSMGMSLGLMNVGPGTADAQPLENPLVFVKYPSPENIQEAIRGNLYRLDPNGHEVNLTQRTDAAVRDPEISWDGTRVVFSMQIGSDTAPWQVWEIGIDGTGLRKISQDASYNDLDPSYLPDGRLLFTTDRLRWSDGYENVPTTQLAVMNAQGGGVEVLKVNTAGHLNPLLGSDGMVYMTQWDFHDRRTTMSQDHEDFDVNRFLLWKVFADGSGLDHPVFGAHTIEDFTPGYVEIRERPNAPNSFVAVLGSQDTQELTSFHPDRLIFVPGTFLTFFGAQIVLMQPQPNQNDDQPVILASDEEAEGTWRSPLPLADGRLVATFFPTEEPDDLPGQLWIMDGDGGNKRLLHAQAAHWMIQAVEVLARTPPTIQPGEMKPQYPYAIINSLDVTHRQDDGQPHPDPGEVVSIRVLREDIRTPNDHDAQLDGGSGSGAFMAWDDPDTAVLGTAPVREDGSLAVIVPTDTPITWELLNSRGQVVVRERFGTELRAGEVRQCAGCHAPHDGSMGATSNLALASPTNLSGQNVDLNRNGVVDLLEGLCEIQPSACNQQILLSDGFESGDLSNWNP